ncbi:hypothetical protein LMG24238_07689 [Paraburkholderia sediminicola]|uniref:Uncharacterized protein n=1 Tax=Paraburkholderia sediminicola TaxID=458836 RepID=A0A6J5CUI3_9BURK|nr:hypothetical protein LMG24238_07689 [Paraburkholderia sediminicola]
MNATTYGLDIAKRAFQMYWVDACAKTHRSPKLNQRIKRG